MVSPRYEEHDPPGIPPIETVRVHAEGKARSVLDSAAGRPVLGVDTEVVLDEVTYGKAASRASAAAMLRALAGRTHDVVSGLCLIDPGGASVVEHDITRVTLRQLADHEIDDYLATGEWEGRAGAYAIQGRGAALVERLDGDYLNVVGLPGALLVRLLLRRGSAVRAFQAEGVEGSAPKDSSTLSAQA